MKAEKSTKTLRSCQFGHRYYKSSACPVCPECEKQRAVNSFLQQLPAPARRALENAGLDSLAKIATKKRAELLSLHGMGPSAIKKLNAILQEEGLTLK